LILKEAGAKTVTRLFSESETRIDMIVSDAKIDEAARARIKKLKIPLLSAEWVVQSLISQKKLKYDAHPEFALSFDENSEDKEVVDASPRKKKKNKNL
jgi:hypothetical protein